MLNRAYNQANRNAYHGLAMEILHSHSVEGSIEAFRNFANRLEAGDVNGARCWANQIETPGG